MTSYQVTEWGEPLERRTYPTPDPQGTEVLLQVELCGVCHSDLHIHEGFFDMGGGRRRVLADLGVETAAHPGTRAGGDRGRRRTGSG